MSALRDRLRHLNLVPNVAEREPLDDIIHSIKCAASMLPDEVRTILHDALGCYRVPEGQYRKEYLHAVLQGQMRTRVRSRIEWYS